MEVVFTDTAQEDLSYWKKSANTAVRNKISRLIQEISQHPFSGTGKPEPLKHELSGYWSRQINKEHRIVYRVQEDKVIVISLRYHYTR
ncbi:MAG: Txe/YoeB family addiction module toxin [Cyclobacteriaceae bacterium]